MVTPPGNKLYGNPSGIPWICAQNDTTVADGTGGNVVIKVAAGTLLFGDLVFENLGGRAEKSLESSPYFCRFLGVVVGGSATGYGATNDATLIGTTMSTVGQNVLIQTNGVAYVAADVSLAPTYVGCSITPGGTTAGRAKAEFLGSYVIDNPGSVIKQAGATVGKNDFASAIVINGNAGTAITADTDTAALSGTVTNATYNFFVFRSTGSTNTTTAMGTAGASLAAMIWPTAAAVTVATWGGVIIHPTGTGDFVGGTTALDDATVVPNAVFFNLVATRRRLGLALSSPLTGAGSAFLMQIGV